MSYVKAFPFLLCPPTHVPLCGHLLSFIYCWSYGLSIWSFSHHLFCSLERAIRFQQVHELHDELDMGLQKWQDQILALHWEATQQAETKATRHLESKRQKVETENRARWLRHTHLMDRLVNL